MRHRFLSALAVVILVMLATPSQARSQDSDVRRTKPSALDPQTLRDTRAHLDRLEKLGLAGVFVLWRDGESIIERGCGFADRERGAAWTPETVSTIGSITKQFTGAAILKLREQGKLASSDPITKYFDGVPADKQGITLHHLLTHSSGIQDIPGAGDHTPIDREEYIRRAMEEPLAFEPGSEYRYSNAGYSLLGAVMELVTGVPYEQWLRDEFFLPLGMENTGYLLPEFEFDSMAKGYRGGERWGTVLERPMAEDGPYWVLRANGGIHSTARDMVRWGQALIDSEVLNEESMTQYWTPHIDESNGDGESFYGYGWVTLELPGGQRLITHNGGNGILGADMMILPDTRTILFVQTNVIADNRAGMRLLEEIGRHLLMGMPYPDLPDVEPLDADQVAFLSGTYTSAEGLEITVGPHGAGLTLTPRNRVTFRTMYPHGSLDDSVRESFTQQIEDAMRAWYERQDLEPMHTLYQRDDAVEEFATRRAERDANRASMFGPFDRFEVLGTCRSGIDPYIAGTMVRIHFARGVIDQVYLWQSADRVRGYVERRGTWPPSYVHVGDGAFVHFNDDRPGQPPIEFRFAEGALGQPTLVLESGEKLMKSASSN